MNHDKIIEAFSEIAGQQGYLGAWETVRPDADPPYHQYEYIHSGGKPTIVIRVLTKR